MKITLDYTELSSLSAPLRTERINAALADIGDAGGGTLEIPPGLYEIGTIRIRDNTALILEGGAVLKAASDPAAFTELSLIYARDARNISISGKGVIDGNYRAFTHQYGDGRYWPHFETDKDGKEIVEGDEINGFYKREKWRPRLMVFENCENITLADFTLQNSAFWTLHLIDCVQAFIRGVSILSNVIEGHVQNADGIDLDACSDVAISDCYIRSSDDSVCLKITEGSRRKVCENISVTNCNIATDESALKIGSESYGIFRNITFSNCTVRHAGCGIGLWLRDDGVVDGWLVNNIVMNLEPGIGGTPIFIWSYPRSSDRPAGEIRNVLISNVFAKAPGSICVSGTRDRNIHNLRFRAVDLYMHGEASRNLGDSQIPTGDKEEIQRNPPDPLPVWSQKNAPYNILLRNAGDIHLDDVSLLWAEPEKPEWGSAIRAENIGRLAIDRFRGRAAQGSGCEAIAATDVDSLEVEDKG